MNFENMIGLGVAGNFTGHLEQAGESGDFAHLTIEDENAPKGIFPFYTPCHSQSFLSTYPLSSSQIRATTNSDSIQAEPEVALICDIEYGNKNEVKMLIPRYFGAYNDCSIRRPNANKISEKKNWGAATKGISNTLLPIDKISKGGVLDDYKIASFLKRDGLLYSYGIDSEVSSYSYFHEKLILWIISKMNRQTENGPLECISKILARCNYPKQAIISVGATKYTEYGEKNFLTENDTVFVVLYPKSRYCFEDIKSMCESETFKDLKISALIQKVTKAMP